jgi:hypothetical protein
MDCSSRGLDLNRRLMSCSLRGKRPLSMRIKRARPLDEQVKPFHVWLQLPR